jgi:hypothetical protein
VFVEEPGNRWLSELQSACVNVLDYHRCKAIARVGCRERAFEFGWSAAAHARGTAAGGEPGVACLR